MAFVQVEQALSPANLFSFSVFITIGGPQAHGHSVEEVGSHRGARTYACRVRTLANTFLANSERSHECERGTQECVRYERLHHLFWAAGLWSLR